MDRWESGLVAMVTRFQLAHGDIEIGWREKKFPLK